MIPRIAVRARMLAALGGAALSCAAVAQGPPPAPPEIDGDVLAALQLKADAAKGRIQFGDCAPCHRRDASGRVEGNIPRLSGQHATVVVKQLIDIRKGRRANPPMKSVLDDPSLDVQAIANIAAYLQAMPIAGTIGKGPGRDPARGKALYDRDCASCHGAGGEGQAAKFFPMVAAQHYGYLLRELNLIRSGERGNSDPAMVKVIRPYAAEDLDAVADYMAQLPPPKR